MNVFLLSTYDLGHQPFALASLCAHLSADGAEVTCNDIAVEPLNERAVKASSLIAIHLAMHTATQLTLDILPKLKLLNSDAHFCFFGLYAPMAEKLMGKEKNMTFIGGEFEIGLVALHAKLLSSGVADGLDSSLNILKKHNFKIPNRFRLPPLSSYAYLEEPNGDHVTTGYTEASRGCKHLCRHCPVVPVYGGRFFIVPKEIVLEDIRQQVKQGAGHISFGDPDFFNGPKHAIRIVQDLNNEFPNLSYDVIIKIEHLLRHRNLLTVLTKTGCRFITTAVESIDDEVLSRLDKGHTRSDFVEAVEIANRQGLTLSPTFIPFTPWTTVVQYRDLLQTIADLGMINHVAPVQLSIRLLIPIGSRMMELEEIKAHVQEFDNDALSYPWNFSDPAVQDLENCVRMIVETGEQTGQTRKQIFSRLWDAAHKADGAEMHKSINFFRTENNLHVPRMSEPWYCCAEPNNRQVQQI